MAAGALVVYGASTSTGSIAYQSTLQTTVPAEVRGRAMAVFDVTWNAARLVSLAAGGALAQVAGVRAVYVAGALLLFAAAVIGFRTRVERQEAHE